MTELNFCAVCFNEMPSGYYRACESCRDKWRKEKTPKAKEFWIMFFRDAVTGEISGSLREVNCAANYMKNPYFLGYRKITVDMGSLQK